MTTSTEKDYLQLFLREHHVPCPACQHDLCGLEQKCCPKCGVELHLGVASVDPYRLAWGVLVALMSLNTAVGVLFAVLLMRIGKWPRQELTPAFCIFLLAIVLGPMTVVFRRWFYRRSSVAQWVWVGAGVVYTAGAFGSLVLAFWR